MKPIKFGKISLAFLRFAIPFCLILVLLWKVDWTIINQVLKKANMKLLTLAFFVESVTVILQGWRWKKIMEISGNTNSFWQFQCINFKAMFFDTYLPGKLGSDFYRWSQLRSNENKERLLGGLIMLRLQGMLVSLFVSVFFFLVFFSENGKSFLFSISAIVLICCTLSGFGSFFKKILNVILTWNLNKKIYQIVNSFRLMISNPSVSFFSTLICIAFMIVSSLAFALAGAAFHMDISFYKYLYGVPALMLVGALPISIHGRGITEVMAIYVWQGVNANAEQVVLTCLSIYVISLLQSCLAGVVIGVGKLLLISRKR